MWPDPQETTDLVTFTEDMLNGKMCSGFSYSQEMVSVLIWYHKLNK